MATKLAIFALLVVFTQVLCVPVTKDLAADIDNAKLRITFFDLEVVELINRINVMEIELGLPIEDLAKGIVENLVPLATVEEVDVVRDAFKNLRQEFQDNSQNLRRILAQQMRTTISRLYDELDSDLSALPITTNFLKAEIANVEVTYTEMLDSIEKRATEADLGIYNAVDGQDGPSVVEIYSDWQAILDIVENERFLLRNVKIVFDARGQDAIEAVEVVIGQSP